MLMTAKLSKYVEIFVNFSVFCCLAIVCVFFFFTRCRLAFTSQHSPKHLPIITALDHSDSSCYEG